MHFHEQRWECKAGCNFWTKIEANFRDHLRQRHSEILNEDDLVRFCQRDAHLNSENVSCPLCKTEEMLLEDLKDHLGYHYELVALCMFAPLIYKEPENHPALLSNQSEQSTADSMEYVPHLTSPGKLKTQSLDALSKPSMSKQRIAFSKFPTPESSSQTSRAVRFPERQFSSYSRPLNLEEKRAARDYETHAVQCTHCRGIYKIQPDYQQTCDVGHSLAQELTRHMFNDVDSNTNNVIEEKLGQLESYRGFDEVSGLLRAIERSLPERSRTSIVDMDRDIVHPKATSGMGFKQSKGEIAGSQAGSDMARRNGQSMILPQSPIMEKLNLMQCLHTTPQIPHQRAPTDPRFRGTKDFNFAGKNWKKKSGRLLKLRRQVPRNPQLNQRKGVMARTGFLGIIDKVIEAPV